MLQVRQQGRRVRALPTLPVRGRSALCRRVRHERLAGQQILVWAFEAARAHATARVRALHPTHQRVVPTSVQDHHPQRCTPCRHHHVVERHRLVGHGVSRARRASTGSR